MKANIHPTYYPTAIITCASCKTVWTVGGTQESINTEICSNCHPFFTGKQNLVDTAGNVERFNRRTKLAEEAKSKVATKKPRKARGAK
jgi:large subunit ribosomal protein L31